MPVDEDREELRKISTITCQTDASFVTRAPLLGSCRLTLSLMCLVGTLGFFLMRLNLSFALVCMVQQPQYSASDDVVLPNANYEANGTDLSRVRSAIEDAGRDDDVSRSLNEKSTPNRFLSPSFLIQPREDDDQITDQTEQANQLNWDKEVQGKMLSAFYYGFCVTQILGGWLSDRLAGSKYILLLSMGSMSLLSMLSPLVAQWHQQAFFALRLALGLASGLSLPAIQPLFARWTAPNERGTLIGLAFAGFTLGSSITFPISSVLCQYGFAGGWPSIFYLSGIFGAVWVVFACFLIYDSPEVHPRISTEELSYLEPYFLKKQNGKKYNSIPWRAIATSVPVHALNSCQFCLNWGFYTLISGLPIFMKEGLKFDITQNGLLSSMPYAAALVAHLSVGKLFDWFRHKQYCTLTTLRKTFNTIGFIIPAISIFAVGQLTYHFRYVAVFLLALSQAGSEIAIMGGFMLSNIDLAPQYSGVLQGISNTIGTIPGFLSPVIIAVLTPTGTQEEWAIVFYISAGMYLFGALSYLIFGSSEQQPWSYFQSVPSMEPDNRLIVRRRGIPKAQIEESPID